MVRDCQKQPTCNGSNSIAHWVWNAIQVWRLMAPKCLFYDHLPVQNTSLWVTLLNFLLTVQSTSLDVFPLCLSFVKSDKWPTKPGFVFHIHNYKLHWQKLSHTVKLVNMWCTSFPLHLLSFSPLLFAVEEAVSSGPLNQNWRAVTWAVLPELIYCTAGACQTYY